MLLAASFPLRKYADCSVGLSFILIFFLNKMHIFVIEVEPLSGMCRQLHQMLPCMKSQLVVIDKFPNTSKDFLNYLPTLIKTLVMHFILFIYFPIAFSLCVFV